MTCTQRAQDTWNSQFFLVRVTESQDPVKIRARWNLPTSKAGLEGLLYYHSIDLLLCTSIAAKFTSPDVALDASGTTLENIVNHTWAFRRSFANGTEVAIKVILTPREGYVSRSDIVQLRMQHSEYVESVLSLSNWDRLIPAPAVHQDSRLLELLASATGAVLVKQSKLPTSEVLQRLEDDTAMRLSFDWIRPTKPRPHRVALVGGRPMPDPQSGQHGSSGYFEAARALGISMVVYDEPGHWLQEEEYAHLREDFVPMDMANLRELPQKLAQSIVSRTDKIDGIVTFSDRYVVATAQAADLLGLPTEPVQDMVRAHHKDRMREVVHEADIQAVALDSADQLNDKAYEETLQALQYPLVVKPCRGMKSKGVKKVTDDASMRAAVRLLSEDEENLVEHGILLETYVDGPEFDANLVMWEGEILFLEVTDNFPCLADASNATLADNFAETVQISNTALPEDEIDTIRSSVSRSLAKLGFTSGVFHCEGRMLQSSMRYRDVDGHGALDLVANNDDDNAGKTSLVDDTNTKPTPDVFLIEVNVRPPGTGGTWATLCTYGVDLGALQFLRAVGDESRFRALSAPFAYSRPSPGDGGGAQWWTAHCMVPIPTHRARVRVPEGFFDLLFAALPDVRPHVLRAEMYSAPGSVVSATAGIGWIAYVLVGTRTSRAHALSLYRLIAESSKKILDVHGYDSGYES